MNETFAVTVPSQLGPILRGLRKSRKLTQRQLGDLIGVSQKRIAQIESAPERTSFEQISRIAAVMGARLIVEVPPIKDQTLKEDSGSSSDW